MSTEGQTGTLTNVREWSRFLWTNSGMNPDKGVEGFGRRVYERVAAMGVRYLQRRGLSSEEAEVEMVDLLLEAI